MLKRLLFAFYCLWAFVFLMAGATGAGITEEIVLVALLPFVVGPICCRVGYWIFTGQ